MEVYISANFIVLVEIRCELHQLLIVFKVKLKQSKRLDKIWRSAIHVRLISLSLYANNALLAAARISVYQWLLAVPRQEHIVTNQNFWL